MPTFELKRVNPLVIVIAVVLIGLFALGVLTGDRPIMAVAVAGVIAAGFGWWLVS